jgi:riboflavin synthase
MGRGISFSSTGPNSHFHDALGVPILLDTNSADSLAFLSIHRDSVGMFTGIIEETGVVERIRPGAKAFELLVRAQKTARNLRVGDSLAINGCCLTVASRRRRGKKTLLGFDVLRETWRLTNLRFHKPGCCVNLERPLRASDRLGGHFVTGHIDGLGRISRWERSGQDYMLEIDAPDSLMRYVVAKGSIAVDGISLTVASVKKRGFRVWIIPHTYAVTTLKERRMGDAVNLEADLLGKYAEKFLTSRAAD